MLTHLTIENFAIIERVELDLGGGLVALTGETGAGKSIVIDAVGGLLGNRLGPEVIRSGTSVARIEGVFDPADQAEFRALLDELGVPQDDDVLILARELNRNGRSLGRINGRAVPNSALQRIGHFLLDLHGQGDHLALLRVSEHLRMLDGFAGLEARRAEVSALSGEVRKVRHERATLSRDAREIARRLDLLRFQVEEIASAGLELDEEDLLRAERTLLLNAERLATGIDRVRDAVSEGEGFAALDRLGQAAAEMADLARIDPNLGDDQQTIEIIVDQLTDVSRRLRRYRDQLDFSPGRLEEIEERLNTIRNLERKYGGTIAEVLAFAENARRELNSIEHHEERAEELAETERRLLSRLADLALSLSLARQEAAEQLIRAIETELTELNMGGARFAVRIERQSDPDGVPLPDGQVVWFDGTGIDRVEFFVAMNPGEDPKPLVKVVSGGETARLMLALKAILARADFVPTLIFDEIDTGIGGQTAVIVGRKIANLAADRQIICVTHLSQIAAYADHHLAVRKRVVEGRTRTEVALLDAADRVEEIAAMLGGQAGDQSAREHARAALGGAQSWKQGHLLNRLSVTAN